MVNMYITAKLTIKYVILCNAQLQEHEETDLPAGSCKYESDVKSLPPMRISGLRRGGSFSGASMVSTTLWKQKQHTLCNSFSAPYLGNLLLHNKVFLDLARRKATHDEWRDFQRQ